MAEDSADPVAKLEGLMAAARRAPHNFVLMKTKDGIAIEGHKTKTCKALIPLVKAAGGMSIMSCQGVMTVKGIRISLTVEEAEVPDALLMAAKRYFKAIGVKAKLIITLPSGEIIGDGEVDAEADDRDAPEATGNPGKLSSPEGSPQPESPETKPHDWKAPLAARLRDLVPQVKALTEAGAPGADRLLAALKAAGSEIAGGNAEQATQILDATERAVDQLGKPAAGKEASAPQDDKAAGREALLAELRKLAAEIAKVADPDRKRALAGLAATANAALKAEDLTAAAKAVAALRKAMADQPAPRSPALLPTWRDARDSVNEQLGQLQNALRSHGLPLFARIADKGLNGITETRLVRLQARLMDYESATGEDRAKAAPKLKEAMDDMRTFLASNPVLPLLEANPLKVPVKLRATLGSALDRTERDMAG